MCKEAFTIALAIIRHSSDNKILIAQRKHDTHLGGLWEFPGGKCQAGESPVECAVREAREETDLTVTVVETWPALTFEYLERIVTLHPFLCRAEGADAKPLGSHQVAWVAPLDLSGYSFPPANASLLARLMLSA